MICAHRIFLQRGDYLIVGIHGDAVVNRERGSNLPLMNLHERVLSVLGCRFVDDVLIDAPWVITPDMIASLNIAEVIHCNNQDWASNRKSRKLLLLKYFRLNIIESPSSHKFKYFHNINTTYRE